MAVAVAVVAVAVAVAVAATACDVNRDFGNRQVTELNMAIGL